MTQEIIEKNEKILKEYITNSNKIDNLEPGSLSYVPGTHERDGDCHKWLASHQINTLDIMREFRNLYSYAIPNVQAVKAIKAASPHGIIEMGAGIGYWAHVLRNSGIHVRAVDCAEEYKNPYFKHKNNATHKITGQFWNDIEIGNKDVLKTADPKLSLMLCWPYMDDFAADCVALYSGKTVIYIGERRGGATANNKFYDSLQKNWKHVNSVRLPRMPDIHDDLRIYNRL